MGSANYIMFSIMGPVVISIFFEDLIILNLIQS